MAGAARMAAMEGARESRSRLPQALQHSLCPRHRCADFSQPYSCPLFCAVCVDSASWLLGHLKSYVCYELFACLEVKARQVSAEVFDLLMQVAGSDSRYLLQLGPSGECSAPCGDGTREKSLSCMDTVLGLPVEMTMCSLNSTTLGLLSEPCNTQQYVLVQCVLNCHRNRIGSGLQLP